MTVPTILYCENWVSILKDVNLIRISEMKFSRYVKLEDRIRNEIISKELDSTYLNHEVSEFINDWLHYAESIRREKYVNEHVISCFFTIQ